MRQKLLYVQPILANYRFDLVSRLSKSFDLKVLCGKPDKNSGFNSESINEIEVINCPQSYLFRDRILYQKGVVKAVKREMPDILLVCANIRDLTFWWLLFWARKNRIKLFAHGQGMYSKKNPSVLYRWIYRAVTKLSTSYVCYTELSRRSLLEVGCRPEKITVADNSVSIKMHAGGITKTGDEPGVLFVGRLRQECNLEQLINAVQVLRENNPNVVLHVVGGGPLELEYRKRFKNSWVVFHGAVYDECKLLKISMKCRVGCYPGNAGLSVVHYFGLRLPPIVHGDMWAHMGPEPSYIKDGSNGMFFSRENKDAGISFALQKIWAMPLDEYRALSRGAFLEYERLNSPTMGEKIVSIISESN